MKHILHLIFALPLAVGLSTAAFADGGEPSDRDPFQGIEAKQSMRAGLANGDEVLMRGGMLGRITDVGEQFVTLKIAQGMSCLVQKESVAAVIPQGTLQF